MSLSRSVERPPSLKTPVPDPVVEKAAEILENKDLNEPTGEQGQGSLRRWRKKERKKGRVDEADDE